MGANSQCRVTGYFSGLRFATTPMSQDNVLPPTPFVGTGQSRGYLAMGEGMLEATWEWDDPLH
jgi:hypothetical protein